MVKLENGEVRIKVDELLACLSEDELIDLADALSCQDAVIKNVADQIISGMTEAGSHGATGNLTDQQHPTPLDAAVMEVATQSHAIAKEQIERMMLHLHWRNKCYNKIKDWAWDMYYAWPKEYLQDRPNRPR